MRPEPQGDGRIWLSDVRSKAAVAAVALVGVAGLLLGRGLAPTGTATADNAVYRYTIPDSARQNVIVDISSRGDVAYSASADGRQHLRLRRAADTASVELPGTAGGDFPVFSPTGEWLAFSVNQAELKKIQLATGTVVTLIREGEHGALIPSDWTADGGILFTSPTGAGGVLRIPEAGGAPERLVEGQAIFPEMLPDGRTLVYTIDPTGEAVLMMVDLETEEADTLVSPGSNAQWSSTGHVLYGHPSGTVFALPFDLERGEPTGPAVPVRESVFTIGGLSFFKLSSAGSLAYLTGGALGTVVGRDELAWMDMSGELTRLAIEPTDHPDIRLSPEGEDVAYVLDDQIYIFDIDLGTNQRFTYEGRNHHDPVWSPDGSRIAFASDRGGGGRGVWVKDVDGRSPAEALVDAAGEAFSPWEWLDDGTLLLTRGPDANADILMTHEDSLGAEPTPLLDAEWRETRPAISPNGTLMAYVTTEGGEEPHVFVREFPSMDGRWQISEAPVMTRALTSIVWANDGSALYYQARRTGRVIRAEIQREPTFRVVDRSELSGAPGMALEDLHPDGERFLVSRFAGSIDNVRPQLVVAVNWIEELRQRLGAGN